MNRWKKEVGKTGKKQLKLLLFVCLLLIVPFSVSAKAKEKKFAMNQNSILLYEGEKEDVSNVFEKIGEKQPQMIWKTQDKNVVTISSKGKITAKKAGKTKITVVSRKNPKQKATIKVIVKKRPAKREMVCRTDGAIFICKNNSLQVKKKTIRTKKEFEKFQMVLKKKQEKGLRKMLKKQYAGTNFKKKSIVLVPRLFSPYMNYKYKGMVTKFDAKGKLVGEIQIERSGDMEEPGVSYPAIVKSYAVVVRVPKAQEAMIDYYQIAFQD